MNSYIRKSATSIGAIIVALFLLTLMVVISVTHTSKAESGDKTTRGRLITIHDRSNEKVILSSAKTIGDALTEAGFTLDPKDIVEPAVSQELIASDYQVNIYRARPVTIIDGNNRTKVVTAYQTAKQIADSAGMTIYDGDILSLDRTDNIIADGVGLRLTIKRATPFEFTLYGKTSTVRTQASTVSEMLAEKNIKRTNDDRLSVDDNSQIVSGMSIRLWREGRQTITVDESVAFVTDRIEDADRDETYRLVKTNGENGLRSVTYEIIVQDGAEVSRVEIASITTKQPIKQVESVGVKGKYTTPSENENITWDFLTSNGFTPVQAAGIMGNLMQEHRFNTSGDGLAQWIGGRKAELYSMPAPENIYTQLNFLLHELTTNYASVGNAIKASNSLTESVQIFQNKFEKCGVCMESKRIEYARDILASH